MRSTGQEEITLLTENICVHYQAEICCRCMMRQCRNVRSQRLSIRGLRGPCSVDVSESHRHIRHTVSSGHVGLHGTQSLGNTSLACLRMLRCICFPRQVDLAVALFILHLTVCFHRGCLDYAKIRITPKFQLLHNNAA